MANAKPTLTVKLTENGGKWDLGHRGVTDEDLDVFFVLLLKQRLTDRLGEAYEIEVTRAQDVRNFIMVTGAFLDVWRERRLYGTVGDVIDNVLHEIESMDAETILEALGR